MSDLINKETGYKIAQTPEELPPLREGYTRLISQTNPSWTESFIENGLVYNRERAHKEGFSWYLDVTSMSDAFSEDEFWERLTQEGIRHRGAKVIVIFDMPIQECFAHQTERLALHLNGTISRGYMVGVIDNYGTKDKEITQKLSIEEMDEKKRISQSNPLPPFYETPHWREDIEVAKKKANDVIKKQQYWESTHKKHSNTEKNKEDNKLADDRDTADIFADIFGDSGTVDMFKKNMDTSSPAVFAEYIYSAHKNGLLKKDLPLIEELFAVPERKDFHPEGNAGYHTLLTIAELGKDATTLEKFAMLCHDLGKIKTFDEQIKKYKKDNQISEEIKLSREVLENLTKHYGHAEKGMELVEQLSETLNMPQEYRDFALLVCKNHMKAHDFDKMKDAKLYDLNKEIPDEYFDSFIKCCKTDALGRDISKEEKTQISQDVDKKMQKLTDIRKYMKLHPEYDRTQFSLHFSKDMNAKAYMMNQLGKSNSDR